MRCATKVDVLDSFEQINICKAYEIDGAQHDIAPLDPTLLERAKPIYQNVSWQTDTSAIDNEKSLPKNLLSFIKPLKRCLVYRLYRFQLGQDASSL